MRLFGLRLANYRVYEHEEIEFQSGLTGIFGANGAGKSYLIEAIPWTLYGRARTQQGDVRSSWSDGETVTEVEFEHEGSSFRVQRVLGRYKGSMKVAIYQDGAVIADGARESLRLIHSIIGLDYDSFMASVFAEQKQVAAFSTSNPAERQRLVLSLLGITPLDKARDRGRAQHRSEMESLKALSSARLEISGIRESVAVAENIVQEKADSLTKHRLLLEAMEKELSVAQSRHQTLLLRQGELSKIIEVGKAKRAEFDRLQSSLAELVDIEAEEQRLRGYLSSNPPGDEGMEALGVLEAEFARDLERFASAEKLQGEVVQILSSLRLSTAPELKSKVAALGKRLEESRERHEILQGISQSASVDAEIAEQQFLALREQLAQHETLEGRVSCPTCGAHLGEEHHEVVLLMRDQLRGFEERLVKSSSARNESLTNALELKETITSLNAEFELVKEAYRQASLLVGRITELTSGATLDRPSTELKLSEVKKQRQAALEMMRERQRYESRLEEIGRIRQAGILQRRLSSQLGGELAELRQRRVALHLDPSELSEAEGHLNDSKASIVAMKKLGIALSDEVAGAKADLASSRAGLAQAERVEAAVSEAERRTYLAFRIADLLGEFRNLVVGQAGPRLAEVAANVFGELTDSEYDQLKVDPQTFELEVVDKGMSYPLSRFSGSEVDLANLSLRIAISEQVGSSFGSPVGLLVLDEVFAPLDEQRRAQMLLVLERLKARFNQVLVVTHNQDIKDQLPYSIEVIKLPGRKAKLEIS